MGELMKVYRRNLARALAVDGRKHRAVGREAWPDRDDRTIDSRMYRAVNATSLPKNNTLEPLARALGIRPIELFAP